jgi:hypothetical protein
MLCLLSSRSCLGFSSNPITGYLGHTVSRTNRECHTFDLGTLGLSRRYTTFASAKVEFCFFKTRRTVSRLMVSKPSRSFNFSAKSRMVHRTRPFGGLVHANAMISASCASVYFLGCPNLGFSESAHGRPSSRYRRLMLETVALQTPSVLLMFISVIPLWSISKIRARVNSRALFRPFFTKPVR